MKRRTRGAGTVYKRPNGRWVSQPNVTLPTGEQKRIFVSAKSHEEILAKLHAIQEQENKRIPYTNKNQTVGEYLDYWLNDIQSKRIRETTMTNYEIMIRKHIKPTMGNHKLRDLSVYNLRNALGLMKERGCSNRIRLECVRVLSACLTCAMREEVVFRNVAQLAEKPKYTAKEIIIWSVEQARMFLDMNKNHPHYIALFLYIVYGMRRGEVLGLRWSDINFDNGTIHIRQQIDRIKGEIKARDLKTKNSFRVVPLKDFTRAALLEHAARNSVIIPPFNPCLELSKQGTVVVSKVGTPLEPRCMNRLFNALVKQSGLPRATPHFMRHIAATVLKDLGTPDKDIQLILGHADIATTIRYYQHGTPDTQHEAMSAVENYLLSGRTAPAANREP